MSESRKELTDAQFRLLMNAQIKYTEAASVASDVKNHMKEILTLVLDAHSVSQDAIVSIDPRTQELVVEEGDSETDEND